MKYRKELRRTPHTFDATQGDWDIRDARGRSARVYAPGAGKRERREKRWYETAAFLKKAAIVGSLLGAGGIAYGAMKKGKAPAVKTSAPKAATSTPSEEVLKRWRGPNPGTPTHVIDPDVQNLINEARKLNPSNFDTPTQSNTHTSMTKSQYIRRLEQLAARVQSTEFASQQDTREKNHTLRNVAIGAGLAGVGYGAGSFLRGNAIAKGKNWRSPKTVGEVLARTRMGHQANMKDVGNAYTKASNFVTNRYRRIFPDKNAQLAVIPGAQ